MTWLHALNVVSLLGLITLCGAVYASRQAWFAFASRRWPSVPGRMLLAGVYGAEGAPPAFQAHVRYQYTVDGVSYDSTRLRFGGTNPFSYRMAASELQLGSGQPELRVFYDPRNPKRACLVTGGNEWTLPLPVMLLLIGVGALLIGWYGSAP